MIAAIALLMMTAPCGNPNRAEIEALKAQEKLGQLQIFTSKK
jgi:hypothetical protein